MALGANFDVDLRLRRTCYKCVATVTGNSCLIILRMNSFSHDFTSFYMVSNHISSLVLISGTPAISNRLVKCKAKLRYHIETRDVNLDF